jgi:hypothetical protein
MSTAAPTVRTRPTTTPNTARDRAVQETSEMTTNIIKDAIMPFCSKIMGEVTTLLTAHRAKDAEESETTSKIVEQFLTHLREKSDSKEQTLDKLMDLLRENGQHQNALYQQIIAAKDEVIAELRSLN